MCSPLRVKSERTSKRSFQERKRPKNATKAKRCFGKEKWRLAWSLKRPLRHVTSPSVCWVKNALDKTAFGMAWTPTWLITSWVYEIRKNSRRCWASCLCAGSLKKRRNISWTKRRTISFSNPLLRLLRRLRQQPQQGVWKWIDMDTYIHTYIHTYISMIHTYIYIHAYIQIYIYIYTYIHAYIHTYIHTYIHSWLATFQGRVYGRQGRGDSALAN